MHVIKTVKDTLTNWRNKQESAWNYDYVFSDFEILLSGSIIQIISCAAELINDLILLKKYVRMQWAEFEKFENKVLSILLRARLAV